MELRDRTIFILSYMRYDGLASTNFTVAKYLSQHNDVYYIDHPYTWKDYLTANRNEDTFKNRKTYFFGKTLGIMPTENPRLKIVITPPVLPINWLSEGTLYQYFLKINERIMLRRIQGIIRAKAIKHYLFMNAFDFHYPHIGDQLKADLTLYYCVDPLIIPYDRKHGKLSEDHLVKHSDVVVCTSKALYEEKILKNVHTYFVPNGAEIADPARVLAHDFLVNKAVAAISKPVVGYLGAIERRMDFELLRQVISKNTGINFVFVGPVDAAVLPAWFKETTNVTLLPAVAYAEVEDVLAGFDVCIIPFKKDAVSRTIFPLKLFEYLGMGKPVVATRFNMDLQDFTGDTVDFAADADAFSAAIQNKLQGGALEREKRMSVAAANTWQDRADRMAAIIAAHLNRQ